ncbi:unnamed protein product [Mytilus coruscus]|uniref:Uncharacterized protein n=1 Tax=Mytilus coruscus TaxID=42192 RepID=A0A6J8EEP4_MYTCO|nr:unnamed protein product [Mytilus coruscus]
MKESSAEIWFKGKMLHWVMEDSKAKDNLGEVDDIESNSEEKEQSEKSQDHHHKPGTFRENADVPTAAEENQTTLNQFQSKTTPLKKPDNEEPASYLPILSEKEEETSGTSDKRIIMMSQKEVFEIKQMRKKMPRFHYHQRAETLLKAGGMPLFPPGRETVDWRKATGFN